MRFIFLNIAFTLFIYTFKIKSQFFSPFFYGLSSPRGYENCLFLHFLCGLFFTHPVDVKTVYSYIFIWHTQDFLKYLDRNLNQIEKDFLIPSLFFYPLWYPILFCFFFQQHSCDFVSFPTCVLSFSGFRFYFVFSFFLVLDSILCLVFFSTASMISNFVFVFWFYFFG
jgi:hypothetical protein